MQAIRIIAGILLIIVGGEFVPIFVGSIFYLSGLFLATLYYPAPTLTQLLTFAIASALIGIILSFPLKQVVSAIATFIAGGFIIYNLPLIFGGSISEFSWIYFLVAGALSVVLMFIWLDFSMLVLSTLTGSILLAQSITIRGFSQGTVFIVLSALGLAIQAILLRYWQPSLESE